MHVGVRTFWLGVGVLPVLVEEFELVLFNVGYLTSCLLVSHYRHCCGGPEVHGVFSSVAVNQGEDLKRTVINCMVFCFLVF